MQEQMTGAAMAMPADTNKAFKVHSLLFPALLKLKGVTRVTFKDEFPEVSVVYIWFHHFKFSENVFAFTCLIFQRQNHLLSKLEILGTFGGF